MDVPAPAVGVPVIMAVTVRMVVGVVVMRRGGFRLRHRRPLRS
jgi:hypothetical protein